MGEEEEHGDDSDVDGSGAEDNGVDGACCCQSG